MAEEIINISGIVGPHKTNLAVSTAANGLTMSSLSDYLDKKTDEMKALVTSATAPATKYMTDILSEIKNLTNATDTWNELILEGIMNSSEQLLAIASISAADANYSKASSILNKLVVDNEAYLKKLNLEELLSPLKNIGNPELNARKLDVDFNIKSNFDIRSLSDFLKTSQLYNPISALLFKRSINTYSKAIAEAIKNMLPAFTDPNIAQLTHGGEILTKLSTLLGTTQETGMQFGLFGKDFLNLTSKESVWNQRNARKFELGVTIATTAIETAVRRLTDIKSLNANGIKKLDTILKFFQGIAALLQGELQDSRGVRFSIGSLFKFDGATFSKQIKNFTEKNVKKFRKTAELCADAIFDFFKNINNIPNIDPEKYGQLVTILGTVSEITANMAEMKKPDKSIYTSVMSIKWIMDVVDNINVSKATTNKIELISESFVSISNIAEMMSVFKRPKEYNVASTLFGMWAVISFVTNAEKINATHKKNLDSVTDVVSTLFNINNQLNQFKKPKSIISTLLAVWEITTVVNRLEKIDNQTKKNVQAVAEISTVLISISESLNQFKKPKHVIPTLISAIAIVYVLNAIDNKAAKAAKKNVEIISEIAVKLSEGMKEVDKDTYKSVKNVSKSINAITFSMAMLALLSGPVKVANKTLLTLTSSISKASKSLSKKEVTNASKNMKMLAAGMAVLGLASVAFAMLTPAVLVACLGMKMLKWGLKSLTSTKMLAKMSMFSIGLATFGLAIWAFGEIVSPEGMVKTAGGIAMLAGAMWLFNGGGKWKGIRTGKGDPTKGMFKAAAALAVLGLATYVWQELTEQEGILKVAEGLGLLALSTYAFSKIKAEVPKNITLVAVGVAALGLATGLWQHVVKNDWESIAIMGATIGGLAIASLLYQRIDAKKTVLSMLAVAAGVAAFGAATWLFSLGNPTWDMIGMIGAVIGGAAVLGYAYQPISPTVALSMSAVALGVAAFGGAVWLWKQANPDWETIGMIGAMVAGGAAAAALYSIPIIPIGAASMLVVGASLIAIAGAVAISMNYGITPDDAENLNNIVWTIAKGFAKVAVLAVPALLGATLFTPVALETVVIAGSLALLNVLPIPGEEKIDTFTNAVWGLSKGYALTAVLAVPALLGATLFTPVALETVVIAGSLALVSLLPMPDAEKIDAFNYSTWALTKGFAKVALLAIPAALGATLFLPVVVSTLATAGVLKLLDVIRLPKQEKIETFMGSIKTIAEGWNDLGLWSLTKSAAKAVLFTPVAGATLASATAIRLIGALKLNKATITANTETIFAFVDTAVAKFNEIAKGKKAKTIKEGASAVGKVANVIHDIGEAVYKIASLEYVTHKVNSKGELIPDKVLKLTDKDFQMVGDGVARILIALTDPLIKIGEANGADVIIGHRRIPGQNKVEAGVKAISGIGGAIMPLADLVKAIAESGILNNKDADTLIKRLNTTISAIVESVCNSATFVVQRTANLEISDPEGLKTVFESIGSIYEPVSGIVQAITESGLLEESKDNTKWLRFSAIFNNIVDALGNTAAKITSFVKSKGGFWNSSDTNAEGIVTVLNSVSKIYQPLSGILKSIKDTGILESENTDAANRLNLVISAITNALTKSVTDILKFVEDNKKINADAAATVMGNINNIIHPISVLIATLGKSGILDDANTHGVNKLKSIIPTITTMMTDTVKQLLDIKSSGVEKLPKLVATVAAAFKPISSLIATLNAVGVLDDSNLNGTSKIKEVLSSITDAVVYTISKLAGLEAQGPTIEKATRNLTEMFYEISKADPTGIKAIRSEIDAIYDKISDEKPWKQFGANFISYEKTAAKIQRDINKIDLNKLILIKEFTDNLRKANLNGNIQSLIEEIRNLINAIEDQNDTWENNFNNSIAGDNNTYNNFGGGAAVVGDQQIDTGGGSFAPATAGAAVAPTKNSNQGDLQLIARKLEDLVRAIRNS